MKKQEPYNEPTDDQVKRHWKAQETSVFRAPKSRDKGLTIIPSPTAVGDIVQAETENGPVNTYKLKTPPDFIMDDPMRRVQDMIRRSKQMTADEFWMLCETPLDLALYEYLFGEMRSSQRGTGLLQLNDAIFKAQQEAMKQLNIAQDRADSKMDKLLKARRMGKMISDKNASSKGDE